MSAQKRITRFPIEAASHIENCAVARLARIDEDGSIFIHLQADDRTAIKASILRHVCATAADLVDRDVLVAFIGGDRQSPVILGLLENALPAREPERHGEPVQKSLSFEAEDQIELKCGRGSITIRKDGAVTVKGTRVTSRASEVQRIKGATVRIN